MIGFRDIFQQIDSDGDGEITKREFQRALCGKRKDKFRCVLCMCEAEGRPGSALKRTT